MIAAAGALAGSNASVQAHADITTSHSIKKKTATG